MNPFKSKKGLGRGLSSLIGDNKTKSTTNKVLISDLIEININLEKTFQKPNWKI